MRPVKLTVAGMRSYRTQRTLDFTDRSLMAILGDTGSGKSSLLEALYGALYGGSTWDARGLGALVADGVQTLQIELVFRARGQTYTVSRSTSRKAYPPAKHVLDGPNGEHLDGDRDVSRRIVELVGLTGQEFLRVVILPQGRFGQLLQGAPSERTPVLRGILGLGVLDRVRETADRQATTLALALEPVVAARARLYPDPRAIAATAEAASNRAAALVSSLSGSLKALRDLDAATRAVSSSLPLVSGALEAVRGTDLHPVLLTLSDADTAETKLREQAAGLAEQVSALEGRAVTLEAELAESAAVGITPAALATMGSALNNVATTLPVLAEQARRHAQERAEFTVDTDQLRIDLAAAQAAKAVADAHQAGLPDLQTAAEEAAEYARRQSDRIAALGDAVAALAAQRDHLSDGGHKTLTSADALRTARHELAGTAAAQSAAEEALASLRAANAAAHVARQHKAGEPCPVCEQTLPASFNPPEIIGERDLVEELAEAKDRASEAATEERQADRKLDNERQQLLALVSAAATSATKVTQLLDGAVEAGAFDADACAAIVDAAVQRVLDLPDDNAVKTDELHAATYNLTEALISATAVDAAERMASSPATTPAMTDAGEKQVAADTALKSARDQTDKLRGEAQQLIAEHAAAEKSLERRRREHEAAIERTAQAAEDLAEIISALPDLISGPLVSALGMTSTDPGAALLEAGELPRDLLVSLRTDIDVRQTELERLSDERDSAGKELRRLDGQRSDLREARTVAVERPRTAARRTWERAHNTLAVLTGTLSTLADAWADLVRTAQVATLPTLPAGLNETIDFDVPDAVLSEQVTALKSRLDSAVTHAEAVAVVAQQGLTLADGVVARLLATSAVTSLEDLAEQVSHAKFEVRQATERLKRATEQIPLAEAMDIGVTALSQQLRVLRQVKDLLNPSSFPQFVVEQRQVALLRIASSLFGQLTRDGYGFDEDFMIVDRRTGQPRHPKTLSGGETFLASLALALALVEISNRSGGQLDCLFLDEGFGSLDASILGEALDVLRLQATGGRLVGVISHLHAVAAELDDVLVVTKEVDGSTFRWLDPDERDAYLLDESAAGLLS